jgi:hypothetical protein
MKQIVKNRIIKAFSFRTLEEQSVFSRNQGPLKDLWLGGSNGEYYISYQFCDSLTGKALFLLSFCGEKSDGELNLLQWIESKLIVTETDREIHLINEDLSIIASLDITTPLIGFHLTAGNNLVILEEASVRLVDFEGKIIMEELFDLVESFSLDGNVLIITTDGETRRIELE